MFQSLDSFRVEFHLNKIPELKGIMALGAIDAVRGTKSNLEELKHIYLHSDR